MFKIPIELVAFFSVAAILSAFCAYAIRADFRTSSGAFDWTAASEGVLSQFFMIVMLGAAALQVLVRYVVTHDIDLHWTEELGRLSLVWAAFLGAAAMQRQDDHIRMTLLYDYVPTSVQKAMRIVADVITLAVMLPIVWLGWQTARNLDIMSTISLGMPLSMFAYPVPIGGLLMIGHTLMLLLSRITGRESENQAHNQTGVG